MAILHPASHGALESDGVQPQTASPQLKIFSCKQPSFVCLQPFPSNPPQTQHPPLHHLDLH